MHVVGPVLVLAEGTTVACLVTTTARLSGSPATVPTVLHMIFRRVNYDIMTQ